MPGEGYRAGAKVAPPILEDVSFGYRIAKEVSRIEIGQSVVVKQGTVLAVEGFEGTDACLQRGGELAVAKGVLLASRWPRLSTTCALTSHA